MQYEIAKKTYIESMEEVTRMTISNFFNLVSMSENLKASRKNRDKRDTLYLIANGRFEMGIIDQADKMEMEQQFLQAANQVIEDSLRLLVQKARFNTFMAFDQGLEFNLIYDTVLPIIKLDVAKALELAKENGSEVLGWDLSLLNSESSVEQTKARNRFNADLNVSYGLNQQGVDLMDAYQDPRTSQSVQVSFSVPILDWGRRKGQIKMAESNHERTVIEINQSKMDFEHNFYLQVSQFNLMNDLFLLRSKTDSISAIRFEITMQKYLKGQIDILKLNDAISAKDAARRNYISTISSFWSEYYAIRKATLFDFIKGVPLMEDYDKIIE
jgi:outer membrane protein TolC